MRRGEGEGWGRWKEEGRRGRGEEREGEVEGREGEGEVEGRGKEGRRGRGSKRGGVGEKGEERGRIYICTPVGISQSTRTVIFGYTCEQSINNWRHAHRHQATSPSTLTSSKW